MGLENLLTKMEQRATATSETPCNLAGVSAKPASVKACTLATPETPQIINAVVSVGNDLPDAANDPAPGTRHFRWLIHFPDRDPVHICCLPEPTHAEVLAMYPDAIAASPMPETRREKIIAMLGDGRKYAVLVEDASANPIIVTVAIRGLATFEVEIPNEYYDGITLLALIEKHSKGII